MCYHCQHVDTTKYYTAARPLFLGRSPLLGQKMDLKNDGCVHHMQLPLFLPRNVMNCKVEFSRGGSIFLNTTWFHVHARVLEADVTQQRTVVQFVTNTTSPTSASRVKNLMYQTQIDIRCSATQLTN